jgi:hypothetical protein
MINKALTKSQCKLKIAIITETKSEAIKFYNKLVDKDIPLDKSNTLIDVTPIYIVYWIGKNTSGCGSRINYVYTTKDAIDTEWFRTVIEPMFINGLGLIEKD